MTTPTSNQEKGLHSILKNEGFKNIAAAIRQSTVSPQFAKAKESRPRYDIRYGLNQGLARKGRYPDEFVTALSEFIHKYNAENAQVLERSTKVGNPEDRRFFRRDVTTSDLEAIIALIDEYGAPLIANLLIAYGYARVGPAGDADAPPAESDDVSDQND
ncbi:MAG TPA: hypothetical protein PLD47_12990 [Aggregatilineales bacterium]|nr:hypothetical protein [Anaerolineales bacterium]HRE48634.1 hypothetical protein [Aggregatilineales bacterium]